MKFTIWDVLTGGVIVAMLLSCALMTSVFISPNTALNPFPPPTLPPTLALPTATATLEPLPATWTPVPTSPPPTLRPSATPLPSETPVMAPSDPAAEEPTRQQAPPPGEQAENVPRAPACDVVSQAPANDTVLVPGSPLLVQWLVRNSTDRDWDGGSVDVRFYNSPAFPNSRRGYDLDQSVDRGETYGFEAQMSAPAESGVYEGSWAFVEGKTAICVWTMRFRVGE